VSRYPIDATTIHGFVSTRDVGIRPKVIAVIGIDQLRRDAKPIAILADTAFEQVGNAERFPDFAQVDVETLEVKR